MVAASKSFESKCPFIFLSCIFLCVNTPMAYHVGCGSLFPFVLIILIANPIKYILSDETMQLTLTEEFVV